MNFPEDYGLCAMFYVKDVSKGLTLDNLLDPAREIIEFLVKKGYSDMMLVHNPRDETQAFLMVPKGLSTKVSFLAGYKERQIFRYRPRREEL